MTTSRRCELLLGLFIGLVIIAAIDKHGAEAVALDKRVSIFNSFFLFGKSSVMKLPFRTFYLNSKASRKAFTT